MNKLTFSIEKTIHYAPCSGLMRGFINDFEKIIIEGKNNINIQIHNTPSFYLMKMMKILKFKFILYFVGLQMSIILDYYFTFFQNLIKLY